MNTNTKHGLALLLCFVVAIQGYITFRSADITMYLLKSNLTEFTNPGNFDITYLLTGIAVLIIN